MNARLVLLPAIALLIGGIYWYSKQPPAFPTGDIAATWRTGRGTDVKQGRNWDELPPETPVRLSVHTPEPRFVYVFSHSDTDGTVVLFPSPELKTDLTQPLQAGQSVLPGTHAGKELAWTTRTQVLPSTTFLVVAAQKPVPELEALLPKLRRWTNSALPSGEMSLTNPKSGEPAAGPRTPLPDPLLQRAADLSLTTELVNGPLTADPSHAGVWIGSWRVKENAATPPPK
ncbi:MAG: hypothetical protein JNK15_13360 [Planctomycetes bacterium]|nr:hypothetical protein [Planctomycetota bacterium]